MKQCPNCQNQLSENAKFCTRCGMKIVSEEAIPKTESQLLCSCGAELKPGAKFCTTCGKKVEAAEIKTETVKDNLCSCGAELKPGAKFCTACGKPVVAQQTITPPAQPKVVTPQPAIHQTPPVAQVSAAMPKKKKRVFLKVAAAILIVAVLGGGGYWAYNEFFGGIRKKLLVEQKISVSDKDQTVKYEDEIAVTVPWGIVDKEDNMRISSVKGLPDMDGLTTLNAYDVELGEQHKFEGFLQITINYKPEDIPSGMTPAQALTVNTFNEEKQQWEPVPYIIDEKKHQITVFSDHLSIFAPGVTGEAVAPGPMMKVKKVNFPAGEFMDEETIINTMQSCRSSQGGTGNVEGTLAGWKFVKEWFGIGAKSSSFGQHALEMKSLSGVNQIATEVGLGFALVQAGIDFSQGKDRKAVLELTKNLTNYSIGKIFRTSAVSICMVGVFAIDYSLNKFATFAISSREDIYQRAYDMYYRDKREKEKINSVWWYKKLIKVAHSTESTADAASNMDKFMHDFVNEFWGNPEVIGQYLDRAGLSQTGFGGLNTDLQNRISNNHLQSIVNTLYQSSVFDRVSNQLRMEAMSKLYNQLCYIQGQLNKVNNIKVVVKLDPECTDYKDVEIGDLEVRFNVSNAEHKELWKGRTDKSGEMSFSCTNLGYVDAGCPSEVIVTVKGPAGKDEEFSGELKLESEGKTSVVEIIIGAPKLEGTWKLDATITKMTMDASLQYMDGMADFYGSGDDYRAERKKVEEQMKGQKAQLPDLKLDGIEYMMDVKREGQYYIIQSKNFNDNTALGSVQYKIKFTSRNTFEGTYIGLNHLNGKENRTEMDLKGTRLK